MMSHNINDSRLRVVPFGDWISPRCTHPSCRKSNVKPTQNCPNHSQSQVPSTHGRGGARGEQNRHHQTREAGFPPRALPGTSLSLFGAGRGRMKIVGNIIRPVDVKWQAETNPDSVLNP